MNLTVTSLINLLISKYFFLLASTSWYDSYRNTYLERMKQGDHEPIRHYVSGM